MLFGVDLGEPGFFDCITPARPELPKPIAFFYSRLLLKFTFPEWNPAVGFSSSLYLSKNMSLVHTAYA